MKNRPDTVIVCYNAPAAIYENYSGKPKSDNAALDDMSETSFMNEIGFVTSALRKAFARVETVAVTKNIHENIAKLKTIGPAVVFNIVESVEGVAEYEIYHAGLYDLLNLSYTGNTPQCLGNCLHKFRAKHILKANGILVPNAITIAPGTNMAALHSLQYPLITKLLKEDASIGISEHSVVKNEAELMQQLKFLFESYRQPAIVEEYIEGREFNIGILGGTPLPVSEISFEGLPGHFPKIVTYEGKWMEESLYYKHTTPLCPAPIDPEMTNKLHRVALGAYKAMECRDYARVDVRVDVHGTPYVIEVNPNPDISTDAGFTRAASKIGIDYDALIKQIAEFAVERTYPAA
jgi:D-alanine-D-alanine ligase